MISTDTDPIAARSVIEAKGRLERDPLGWARILGAWLVLGLLATAALAQKPQAAARDQIRFGTEMAQRGLWNEALFRYERALELRPENAAIYNNMAVAYEALGLFEEALANYRRGLRIAPTDKALKRNYARFVEFYQRFKPDDEPDQSAQGSEVSSVTSSDGGER